MIDPRVWLTVVNGRLSLRADKLNTGQLDEILAVLNEQHFDNSRLTFAANAVATCLNDEHKLDLLRHLLLHGHEYRDPNRPKPKPDEDVPLDFHLRAICALRNANYEAKRAGMPTIIEPEAWLKFEPWKPDPEEAKKAIAATMVAGKRGDGMRSVGSILAGKSKRVLNPQHPRFKEIMDVMLLVLTPEDIVEVFRNGAEVVKVYKAKYVKELDENFEPKEQA